jgi:hypothetical protein
MVCDSILRGWFNTVAHEDFNRCLSRYEFQPELLFRESRWTNLLVSVQSKATLVLARNRAGRAMYGEAVRSYAAE